MFSYGARMSIQNHTSAFRRSLRSILQASSFIGLVAVIVAWMGAYLYLSEQKAQTFAAAKQNADNLARAFDEQIDRSIKSVDQGLLFVRTQFENDPIDFDLQTWGKNDYYLKDLAIQLSVINPDGMMRASNVNASSPPVDLSDREHFRVHLNTQDDKLFVSKPVLGRVTKKWTIQLTRKIRGPNDTFGGVLVASIDPYYLSRFYETIDVGKGGGISVIGTDGVIRARGGLNADILGKQIDDRKFLQRVEATPSGSFIGSDPVDGTTRLLSYRKVKDFPLIVTVSLDNDEIFDNYERNWLQIIESGAIFTCFVILAVAFASRQKLRLDSTQAALVEKSDTLGLTLANMSQGIIVLGETGDVQLLNDQARLILGLPSNECEVPFSYAVIKNLEFKVRTIAPLEGSQGRPDLPVEEWNMSDGRIIEVRDAPLPHGGSVRTLTDVTRQRQYQTNLEQALDRAEAASRTRTAFLASMSHEMRTPLNGVISMADLLTHTSLDVDQRRYVDVAKYSAEHLLQLIDDILDVTKLEADRLEFEAIPFNIRDILNDTLGILVPKAQEKSLSLGCFVDKKVPREMIGDPGRFRQILINLVGNGVKFTSSGHVHVEVDIAEAVSSDPMTLKIDIIDTGIGIAPEHIPALFKDFSQVDSSISRRYGGTGLGLLICRKLIGRMGGTIDIDSTLGQGTCFRIRLPLTISESPAETAVNDTLAGISIGLLSSDPYYRELLGRLLTQEGSSVALFESTDQAKAWLGSVAKSPRKAGILIADLDAGCSFDDLRAIASPASISRVLPISSSLTGTEAIPGVEAILRKPVLLSHLTQRILAAAERTSEPAPEARVDAVPEVKELRLSASILLAEDNPTNQFAIKRILENMGAVVRVVDNGLQAVRAVEAETFDLVLMDMMMPEMDGLTATRVIRNLESRCKHVPIIALTANALAEDRKAALDAGMNAFATKPTTRQRLHAAITEVLKQNHKSPQVEVKVPEADVCNLDVFNAFREEMGPECSVAIEHFLKDTADRLSRILQSSTVPNAVQRDSHAIKSAAGMLGLEGLSVLAANIEKLCRDGKTEGIGESIQAMEAAFREAEHFLRKAA